MSSTTHIINVCDRNLPVFFVTSRASQNNGPNSFISSASIRIMAPPEGLTIGSTSKPWTIGRLLGSGACGSVHELLPPPNTKSSNQRYAIKLAKLPAAARAGGNTKRKKTVQERNADLISHEYWTLQNLGPDVRGTFVPDIPFMGSPPAYGDLVGATVICVVPVINNLGSVPIY